MELISVLLTVSERAANIARCCRSHPHLTELLVQEKSSSEKNPRFVHDFKTLADVLIQETVRHVVGQQFPGLKECIFGEENAVFTNMIGETVEVCIQEDERDTAEMLFKVLDNDIQAAEVLAHEVHRDVSIDNVNVDKLPDISLNDLKWDISTYGVWIDPIDSTAEYIAGENGSGNQDNVSTGGLQCVTVLIGVFDHLSGAPVMGVVNQPFHEKKSNRWTGHAYWGIHRDELSAFSIPSTIHEEKKVVMLSYSESADLRAKMENAGYIVSNAPGAGYKLLSVALGYADAYILSKGTTFQWDTCGPHALLLSLKGGVVSYESILNGELQQIKYNKEEAGKARNTRGIVAFRDVKSLEKIIQILQ